jgi:hypothetical protein
MNEPADCPKCGGIMLYVCQGGYCRKCRAAWLRPPQASEMAPRDDGLMCVRWLGPEPKVDVNRDPDLYIGDLAGRDPWNLHPLPEQHRACLRCGSEDMLCLNNPVEHGHFKCKSCEWEGPSDQTLTWFE